MKSQFAYFSRRILPTVLGLLGPLAPTPVFAQDRERPNVIFILADDLGYGDLSIFGQEKLQTPNIDRLGDEGMVFTQHYSGNTVCSPSRACLMTGQHPGKAHTRWNFNERAMTLDEAMVTLPRLFKNAGYATGAFGKWGLGHTSAPGPENPLTHGFDTFVGWKSQVIAHTYFPRFIVRDGVEHPLPEGTYIHDLIMADALHFIESNARAGIPFFAYIPTAIPHAAMHAPPDLHAKWREVFPEFDHLVGEYGAGKLDECPPVQNPIAGFAAMMENLDNQVGEILAVLNETGADKNTLIIFASDNGAHCEGGHDPEFWNSNGPFRGIKRDFYEGGIRTPFLARWPAAIEPSSTSEHISAFWDFLPTAAELTGQPVPSQSDGISYLPTLIGNPEEQVPHEYLYWEATLPGKPPFMQAVRLGDWKAVLPKAKDGQVREIELYNLANDIGETENLAKEHPGITHQMKQIMREAHTPLELNK